MEYHPDPMSLWVGTWGVDDGSRLARQAESKTQTSAPVREPAFAPPETATESAPPR